MYKYNKPRNILCKLLSLVKKTNTKFSSGKDEEARKIATEMYFMYTKEQFCEADEVIDVNKRVEGQATKGAW